MPNSHSQQLRLLQRWAAEAKEVGIPELAASCSQAMGMELLAHGLKAGCASFRDSAMDAVITVDTVAVIIVITYPMKAPGRANG